MNKWWILKELPDIKSRYIVVDTETTGGSKDDHHILEIAAIEIENGFLTGNNFHGFIKPRRKIDFGAQEVHKMNNYFYKDNFEGFYDSDKKIMENFLKFAGNSLIFAHNALFDSEFINNELKFWNLPEISLEKYRCSCKIFRNLFFNKIFSEDIKGFSLGKCSNFFKIKYDFKNLHGALFDATLLAKLISSIYLFTKKNPSYLKNRKIENLSQFNKDRDKEEFKKYFSDNNNIYKNNNKSINTTFKNNDSSNILDDSKFSIFKNEDFINSNNRYFKEIENIEENFPSTIEGTKSSITDIVNTKITEKTNLNLNSFSNINNEKTNINLEKTINLNNNISDDNHNLKRVYLKQQNGLVNKFQIDFKKNKMMPSNLFFYFFY